jgi:2,3-bisphosphoglycerate-independent phosphoglycerate mutase
MAHALLFFVDGVGLGDDDASTNPFLNAALPTLHDLLGVDRITRSTAPARGARASLFGVDATMGLTGTPQSGTGQATLLTGIDCVAVHGRHYGPHVPTTLRQIVREKNILVQAQQRGFTAAFANAYPEEVLALAHMPSDAKDARTRRGTSFLNAGPPLAALGAGLLTRYTQALERGDAVASEITNEGWREKLHRTSLPLITPEQAGANLARIVAANDVTLFAHYATDYAGHQQDMNAAVMALERLDRMLHGLLETLPDDATVILVSDHGNIEDTRTGHTRNAAIGILIGPAAMPIRSLVDVAPALLNWL